MAKNYTVAFGSGNPASNTGLTPTFTVFKTTATGTNATPPGITEIPSSTGLYYFTYGPTNAISFVIDGGSALSSLARYVVGQLDPADAVDEGISTMLSEIGTTASSFGTTATDPATLYGYLKRLQEFNEGNQTFDKSTSAWAIYSRGSSTMLASKTLNDSSGNVTRS